MSGFWWDTKPMLSVQYKKDGHDKWHFVLRQGDDGTVEALSTVQGFDSKPDAEMAVEVLARGFHIK